MKPTRNEKEIIQFTFRLNKEIHKQITARALKNKRSLNKEIEFILENELKK